MYVIKKLSVWLIILSSFCCFTVAASSEVSVNINGDSHPATLFIRDHEQAIKVFGEQAALPGDTVRLHQHVRPDNETELDIRFHESWSSGFYLVSSGVDLRGFKDEGTVEFQIRVDAIDDGSVSVSLDCEPECHPNVKLREWAQDHAGKGWQKLAIPLSCLVQLQGDLSKVTRLFNLETGGDGHLAIKDIAITKHGKATMACPDDKVLATTPHVLNEYWSVSWWKPRHKDRVRSAKENHYDVVLLGDSITEGWGASGKSVWESHFPDVSMLNLGFGGDRTENLLWRLQHGEFPVSAPDLAVIMVGTNNTGYRKDSPEAIRDGVRDIIRTVKEKAPDTQVLLYAIFPRGATKEDTLRQNNERTNVLLKTLAESEDILYQNINKQFLREDEMLTHDIMPDLLHPREKGYEIWASDLEKYISRYVQKNSGRAFISKSAAQLAGPETGGQCSTFVCFSGL